MKKKKTALSLYASKNRRKLKKRDGKRIGRPRNLQFPRSSKDHDVTFGYEDEKMSENGDERETSIAEESFQFRVDAGASCQGAENMAGPPPSSSSPSSSSPSSSSSDSDSDDEDFWNRPYIRNCCRQLKNDNFIRNLIQKLYRTQCLRDFILLVTLRWLFVTIKHSISIVFGMCQVAVSEINYTDEISQCHQEILASGLSPPQREAFLLCYTDEISQCHQEILASGLSPPQREGSVILFWTQKLWTSH